MAKLMVFDSRATVDTAGNDVTSMRVGWEDAISEETAVRTYPVRTHSPFADIDTVGWEIFALDLDPGAEVVNICALRFWMEFYPDQSHPDKVIGQEPQRDWPGVSGAAAWPREVLALSGGTTSVQHYRVIRELNVRYIDNCFQSWWLPLSVHAPWVRLAMYMDVASSTGYTEPSQVHLKVYANVGGHSEREYLYQNGDKPYAYNAFNP